jgi:hypothetical protein
MTPEMIVPHKESSGFFIVCSSCSVVGGFKEFRWHGTGNAVPLRGRNTATSGEDFR